MTACRTPTVEEEFKMTPAMQEIVLSFLTRMAFLFGEGIRDAEFKVRSAHGDTGHLLVSKPCKRMPGCQFTFAHTAHTAQLSSDKQLRPRPVCGSSGTVCAPRVHMR